MCVLCYGGHEYCLDECSALHVPNLYLGHPQSQCLVIAFIAVPPVDNCPWDAKYALERFWRSIACADEVRSGLVLNSRTSVSELVTSVVLHGLLLFGGF